MGVARFVESKDSGLIPTQRILLAVQLRDMFKDKAHANKVRNSKAAEIQKFKTSKLLWQLAEMSIPLIFGLNP